MIKLYCIVLSQVYNYSWCRLNVCKYIEVGDVRQMNVGECSRANSGWELWIDIEDGTKRINLP